MGSTSWVSSCGLRPELERRGFLLPQHPQDAHNTGQRPADVYLPAFAGYPTAFDFAITGFQQQETFAQASIQEGSAAAAYARHKDQHLHTQQACQAQGVAFVPMVAECRGAWDAGACLGEEPAAC
eukprot:s4084_g2.t1